MTIHHSMRGQDREENPAIDRKKVYSCENSIIPRSRLYTHCFTSVLIIFFILLLFFIVCFYRTNGTCRFQYSGWRLVMRNQSNEESVEERFDGKKCKILWLMRAKMLHTYNVVWKIHGVIKKENAMMVYSCVTLSLSGGLNGVSCLSLYNSW